MKINKEYIVGLIEEGFLGNTDVAYKVDNKLIDDINTGLDEDETISKQDLNDYGVFGVNLNGKYIGYIEPKFEDIVEYKEHPDVYKGLIKEVGFNKHDIVIDLNENKYALIGSYIPNKIDENEFLNTLCSGGASVFIKNINKNIKNKHKYKSPVIYIDSMSWDKKALKKLKGTNVTTIKNYLGQIGILIS